MSEGSPLPSGSEANGGAEGAATPTPAPENNWMSGFDEDSTGYIQNKGWKEPGDVLNAYRQLESFRGVPEDQLLKLPQSFDDPDAWGDIYQKLGRPESGADYQLPEFNPPEGVMDATDFFRDMAHKHGLSQRQAEGMYADWNAHVSESAEQMSIDAQNEMESKVEVEMTGLKKDWGADYDKNIAIGQRAIQRFQVDQETVEGIESALGPRKTLELFAQLGAGVGEDTFISGSSAPSGHMTKEMASARITELRGNKDWSQRYLNGDKAAVDEMQKLLKIKAGM